MEIAYDNSRISFLPHRQFRPRGSHPNLAHWNLIRNQALERDGHQCRCCEAKDGDVYDGFGKVRLEVHHRHYRTFGKETLDDVTTLCTVCHRAITDSFMRSRDQARVFQPTGVVDQVHQSLPSGNSTPLPIAAVKETIVESLPSS